MAAEDPADLVSTQEMADFLKLGDPASFSWLQTLVTRASLVCEGLTNRKLKARAVTSLRLKARPSYRLLVDLFPIDTASTVTITVDGTAQTIWRTESDGDPATKDIIVASDDPLDTRSGYANHFYRPAGWAVGMRYRDWTPAAPPLLSLAQHPYVLLASWTGGYATVPEDLKQACCYIGQRIHRDWDKQETDITTMSLPTGGSAVFVDPSASPWPRRALDLLAGYTATGLTLAGV